MNRIFTEEVSRRYKKECGEESHPGSISCLQRFGGSLNLNVHIHSIFLDGAFASRGESLTFAEAPVPTQEEIHTLVVRIHTRAIKWLRRHGYMKEKDGDGIDPTPLQAMTQLAMSGGNFLERARRAREGRTSPNTKQAIRSHLRALRLALRRLHQEERRCRTREVGALLRAARACP